MTAVAIEEASAPARTAAGRVYSIDVIRGLVMVLMAIDHARVYSGLPAGGPTPGIFFTRWVTHFCAPAFVFLAGTSAFLYHRSGGNVARFLFTRGLWLIFLELTVLRVAWTFNADFGSYNMAGVIWALGWSMIALAALSRLPAAAVGALGVLIMAGHNLLPMPDGSGALWKILYVGFWQGPFRLGENGPPMIVLYSLIPWAGVMMAGYGFGSLLAKARDARDARYAPILAVGLGATALFVVLRSFNIYGEPNRWEGGFLSFLNTSKYPASLQFLLMTLGPVIALIPLLERLRAPRALRAVEIFGRVPFSFYVLHIPLIHLLAVIVSQVRLGFVSPWLFENHPMGAGPAPDGYTWSLPLLYLVWAIAIALLYPACRRFADLKARRRDWWLSYL